MKQWPKQQAPVAVVEPLKADPRLQAPTFKCISCLGNCDVLFDGTSYCQGCLKEKLRLGR